MKTSIITQASKQVMKVYTAKAYTPANPRTTPYVQINIPEYVPTIPQDGESESIGLSNGFFANSNFQITTGIVQLPHYLELPLLSGTTCPAYMKKGTPFLLFTPTTKLEEGYLMYI